MRKAPFVLIVALGTTALLAGCGNPAPSTPVAPDVKEPDNRNVSGSEILKRKLGSDPQKGP